jgi:hypothetical protein
VPLTLKTTQKTLKGPQNPNFCLNYAQSSLEARAKICLDWGGGEGLLYRPSCTPRTGPWRTARDHAAQVVQLATWQSYPPHGPSTESSSVFVRVPFSDPIFESNFGGLLVLKMGHAAYLQKSLDVYFPTI